MVQAPYQLDERSRSWVMRAFRDGALHRGWFLLAAHVRSSHVHAVVRASESPERVVKDFKAYASRRLNQPGLDIPERKRWARHASTRYLWKREEVEQAIQYVVHEQGEPMAVFEDKDRLVRFGQRWESNVPR